MRLATRISRFFLLLGLVFLGLFALSLVSSLADYRLILAGTALLAAGALLNLALPPPKPPPSGRFGLLSRRRPGQSGSGKEMED
jgi:hypothetical protein